MADVVYLAIIVAFFALCVMYVGWCDRIIGPDEMTSTPAEPAGDTSTDESTGESIEVAA